jgi:hypothetical protein
MNVLPGFIMTIAQATSPPGQGYEVMSIIIRRPYAFLEKELRKAFKGQKDIKVIVDGRYGERRTEAQPITSERRCTERRRPNEELLEVVLSA